LIRNFEALKKKNVNDADKRHICIAVAAAQDLDTLGAVYDAREELGIKHILVGDTDKIKVFTQSLGFIPDWVINADSDEEAAGIAVNLVKEGKAQALMKGKLQTGLLLKAVLDKEKGIRDSGLLSHLAILESPNYHKLIFIADGGMNIAPDLEQKKQIIENSVKFMRSLGYDCPKVAVLAAVETVSSKMQETIDANALAQMNKAGEITDCIIEGPLSFDIAINAEAAATKGFDSEICGDTDLFITHDISAGNILCKSMMYLGNAKMAGCVLGAKAPIILVSRGATAEEKLLSIAFAAAQA